MLTTNQLLQQGRYRIVQPLGQSVSGADYEVFDTAFNTNVILKEISFGQKKLMTAAETEAQRNSFANEAQTLMRIQHPTILKIHGYFSEIDVNYLVSEFTDGNSLSEMLRRVKKPFPLAEVSHWTEKLLDAVNYLHHFVPPVVHRNIKPENLRLTLNGEIKLLISSLSEPNQLPNAKLNYLPLEQIWKGLDAASQNLILNSFDEESQKNLDKPADASSDIYALGATLYHLLTAELPVDALERVIEILEGNPDPLKLPHEINPAIPLEISEVLMRALEIRRENRFHSAVIMRQVWRTAFIRAKERESAETEVVQEEEVLEIPMAAAQDRLEAERRAIEIERLKIEAEQKRLEEERRAVEEERLKIEAEQKRQAELLEQQQLKALQNAVEAEEISEFIEVSESEKVEETLPTASETDDYFPEIIGENEQISEIAPASTFMDSYTEAQEKKKNSKALAAIVAVVLLICAAGGIWFFTSSNPSEVNQAVSTNEQKPNAETVAASPKTEAAPEVTASPAPSAAHEIIQTSANTSAVKPKTTVSQTPAATPKPEVKKPSVAAAKTPEPQKKPVTVDDLINDN